MFIGLILSVLFTFVYATAAARSRRADLAFFMRTHTFSGIYVFQRYTIDADTGKMTIREGDDLGPDYVLEPVRTERLLVLTQTRLSRLVEIRDGKSVLTKPELEKARTAYLENFFKRLP